MGDDTDAEKSAQRFIAWLSTTDSRWLVVLDDLAVPGDLLGLWPPVNGVGETMVTTRRRDAALAGPWRELIDVGLFTREEAGSYLAHKLRWTTTPG